MSDERNIPIAHPATGEEEWLALKDSLMSGWLTQGPKVAEFEKAFAARHGVAYALASSSCTAALHMILSAMNIGPGDEVIVPAFTWVATANSVLYCGAKPVFTDVDRLTFNMDAASLAPKIGKRTKAIIAVHLFGLCADMHSISEAVQGVPVIEDAACAAGSSYRGCPAGSLGLAAAFSFHPRKSITTGEGGMVTTSDSNLARRIHILRNHGAETSEEERHNLPKPYLLPEFNVMGFNYRMTDLQGAVGLVQLGKLSMFIEYRQRWAEFYERELAGVEWLRTPEVQDGYGHGWQSYVCYVDERKAPMRRNEIMEYLMSKGINTRPGTHAVHMLGYYREKFGFSPDDYPVARDCDRYTVAIPLHNRMNEDDFNYIVSIIKGIR